MIRILESMRSVVGHSLEANHVDLTKYSILGCHETVRTARRASRRLLPRMVAQLDSSLETPHRAREYDIYNETEFDGEEFDKIETGLNEYGDEDIKLSKRKELAQKKYIKRKILEKKFFKPPIVPNILSWSAKEQIRLLNKQNPEEWTVDRLADSFPTSRDSIIRILKSKYKPKSEVEIVRHDYRAQKNLLGMKSTLTSDKVIQAQNLLNSHKSDAFLPIVNTRTDPGNAVLQMHNMGVFEAIVKEYSVKNGTEERSYEHDDRRNSHRETHATNNRTVEGKIRVSGSKKHWTSSRLHQKMDSSKDEFNPGGKRSNDEDSYHFTTNTNYNREQIWNHQQPQRYQEKYFDSSVDPDDEIYALEVKDINNEATMMKRDGRCPSKTNFSKQHGNDPIIDTDRVVYDENGDILYRIP